MPQHARTQQEICITKPGRYARRIGAYTALAIHLSPSSVSELALPHSGGPQPTLGAISI